MIHVVLLSGGSGKRLWPLSNATRSKQFLKVLRDDAGNHVSMVQRVFSQIEAVDAEVDVTIATSAEQVDALALQVGGRYVLVDEPERRDTAPAIMLACADLELVQGADADDPVIVMPIDTYADQDYYDRIPQVAQAIVGGAFDLVLLGATPTYPSAKYGYILPGRRTGGVWHVNTFKEKPDERTAAAYIEAKGLWNCGVFGFRLGWLRGLSSAYVATGDYEEMRSRYRELPRNSFDYEVVEKASSIGVLPYTGIWKDLGTWNTLTEEMADATSGLVWLDEATCSNVHVVNETSLPMVVAGIADAVVVATPDGVLVSGKEASSNIKDVVDAAANTHPMYERTSWGEYRILDERGYDDGGHVTIRELSIAPGRQLAYHRRRGTGVTWTVVAGTGQVVIDGKVRAVRAGDCLQIEGDSLRAARATGELRIVEIARGSYEHLGDVERCGNYFE